MKLIGENKKKNIKIGVICATIATIIAVASFLGIKYQVEGEKNMPYNLSKIIVISSAVTSDQKDEGQQENQEQNQQEGTSFLWDEKVIQTNDVYVYLTKNDNYKTETSIKSVRIENVQILKRANIGKIQAYMPNSLDDELYKYINDFVIGNSLTYTGGIIDNKKTLEICSKGGAVCLSFANVDLGRYQSNEDAQIEQGAAILERMGLKDEDLQFKVSFDLIINVGNKAYKGNVVLDLPIEGLVGNKESHTEITDFSNVIFKRCKN